MIVKAYSGSYSVFASGLLFSFSKDDEFKLFIAPSEEFSFNLHIRIIEDGGKRKLEKTVTEKDMYLECSNFGAGAGTTQPLEIATADGKRMYMHFWIETVDESKLVRSLKYTIYIEN